MRNFRVVFSPVTGRWVYDIIYVLIMMGIGAGIGIALNKCGLL